MGHTAGVSSSSGDACWLHDENTSSKERVPGRPSAEGSRRPVAKTPSVSMCGAAPHVLQKPKPRILNPDPETNTRKTKT